MNPFLADLDDFLATDGQDIILRRTANATNLDCPCRAFVRRYDPSQLAGQVQQGDSQVVISPTDINRAQWPGGVPITSPPAAIDPRIPLVTDRVVIAGRVRTIVLVEPIYFNGELSRINLQVRG